MFREGEASQPPRLAPDDSEGRGDQSDHMSQVSDSQIPQDWSPSGPRPPLRQSAIIRLDFDKRFQEPQPLRLGSLPSRCPGISPLSIYNLVFVAGTIVSANIYICGPHHLGIKLCICWTVVSIEESKL